MSIIWLTVGFVGGFIAEAFKDRGDRPGGRI